MTNDNKQIILMRHAAAESLHEKGDICRNLTATGKEQAASAALFISNLKIDKILVSPATRTKKTLDIILNKNNIDNIEVISQIYKGSREDIFNVIKKQANYVKNLLIIGHNPNIYALALYLTAKEDINYMSLMNFPMDPASIVTITISNLQSWMSLKPYCGQINQIFTSQIK